MNSHFVFFVVVLIINFIIKPRLPKSQSMILVRIEFLAYNDKNMLTFLYNAVHHCETKSELEEKRRR